MKETIKVEVEIEYDGFNCIIECLSLDNNPRYGTTCIFFNKRLGDYIDEKLRTHYIRCKQCLEATNE